MAVTNKNKLEKEEEFEFGERFIEEHPTNAAYASIFSQPAYPDERKTEFRIIRRDTLHEFPNHPFKVKIDDEMNDLRDSIIDNGVLEPLVVIPNNNGEYTILAGHRRCKACELAQISEVPVIIHYGLTDDQATIIMVDSNKQRENILPSERAFAYKMKMDAMNRQGKRNDLTFGTQFQKLNSRDALAKEENIGSRQLGNYIRLTHLIPQLLDLVDNDVLKESPSMAMKPAVEISYLTPDEQKYFYDTVKTLSQTPSVEQAKKIKDLSKSGELTQTLVMQILMERKPNQRETVKVDSEKLSTYFKGSYTPKQYEAKMFERLDGFSEIQKAVYKHTRQELDASQIATMLDNLLGNYAKEQNKKKDNVR